MWEGKRKIPDSKIWSSSDGSDKEEVEGWDVDVWSLATTLHKRGEKTSSNSFIFLFLQEESKSNYVELDLDEVLDIEEEGQRRKFILNVLIRSKATGEDKNVGFCFDFVI